MLSPLNRLIFNDFDSPIYIIAGGVLGAIIVYLAAKVVPILGSTTAISVFIVVQLTVGVFIDHFGLFGMAVSAITLQKIIQKKEAL